MINNKKIVIFTDEAGWHGKQLEQAFAHLGYDSIFISLSECYFELRSGKQPIRIPSLDNELPCAVFVRGIPGGSLEEVTLYLDFLHALRKLNVPVYNQARAIEKSVDKAMTSFLLHSAGIDTPLTWVVHHRDKALEIAERELMQGNLVICKPLFGSQGEGIRLIRKKTDLLWLTDSHGVFYLQRFVQCAGTEFFDYRVFIINKKVVAAMRRYGQSWLNNVAQGASCEIITPDKRLCDIALQSVRLLKMDYAGVDIIEDRAGHLIVIEINSVPAWKGLESVYQQNIAQLLANDLVNRLILKKT